jgi:hypothetical protein
MRPIFVKYPTTCRVCGCELSEGRLAHWRKLEGLSCLKCGKQPLATTMRGRIRMIPTITVEKQEQLQERAARSLNRR